MADAKKHASVPNFKILRIAAEVPADPATVRKVIAGLPVKGSVGFRIRDVLERHGIKPAIGEQNGA